MGVTAQKEPIKACIKSANTAHARAHIPQKTLCGDAIEDRFAYRREEDSNPRPQISQKLFDGAKSDHVLLSNLSP